MQHSYKEVFFKVIKQLFVFICVSGIGWFLDFSIYYYLTSILGLPVLISNCLSSIPAILWVFSFSSKKIFVQDNSKLSLYQKCLIYFLYQMILVLSISFFAEYIHGFLVLNSLMKFDLIAEHSKIIVKIFITPITMTINFIIMKILIEKL